MSTARPGVAKADTPAYDRAMCSESSLTRRGAFVGEVACNDRLCQEHYRLCLRLVSFPPTRAGQFVQLQCRGLGEQAGYAEVDWPEGRPPAFTQPELTDHEPLLRRPLSLAGREDLPGGAVELELIYRTIGTGTRWLRDVKPGQRLSVLGPLGNGFAMRADKPYAALVGGGVGIPPMIYQAQALAGAGKRVTAFCGARSAEFMPLTITGPVEPSRQTEPTACAAEFDRFAAQAVLASDDGSLGFHGFVSAAFALWFEREVQESDALAVYCCGPEPLMRTVGNYCVRRGIACQLAMERHMACGMGTCQSCVVKIADDSQAGWSYKLCCTDGPVFDAASIVWD